MKLAMQGQPVRVCLEHLRATAGGQSLYAASAHRPIVTQVAWKADRGLSLSATNRELAILRPLIRHGLNFVVKRRKFFCPRFASARAARVEQPRPSPVEPMRPLPPMPHVPPNHITRLSLRRVYRFKNVWQTERKSRASKPDRPAACASHRSWTGTQPPSNSIRACCCRPARASGHLILILRFRS